jgi:hypothetical protein
VTDLRDINNQFNTTATTFGLKIVGAEMGNSLPITATKDDLMSTYTSMFDAIFATDVRIFFSLTVPTITSQIYEYIYDSGYRKGDFVFISNGYVDSEF